MCGVVASHGSDGRGLLVGMLEALRHRGPDGDGMMTLGRSGLGHTRLAILDLEAGRQPIANEFGDLALSFNGEIYNHETLRADLWSRHRFRTRTDTEVILHLFEEEGENAFARLDGMFALAMAGPGGLLLARDPMGIKPIYYGTTGSLFLAASEIKAFPKMDRIHLLPAGHYLRAGGDPVRFSFPLIADPPLREPTFRDAVNEVRRRLAKAVVKRLMADVPVGVFLSGGLDSSLVASLMRPNLEVLHSFATGLEGAPDLEPARQAAEALGTRHHEHVFTAAQVEEALPGVVASLESFDAPLVRSAVPMFFLSAFAANHVKVVLTGEGADELFGGYAYLRDIAPGRLKPELAALLERLQDTNLQRGDRMSMAHGLEARVPFLDLELVRYVSRLPEGFVASGDGREEKWLLREAGRGLLPSHLLHRRKLKFSEGTGVAQILSALAAREITEREFRREREVAQGVVLRSREELLYYRLWKEALGPNARPHLVGRTRDLTAAADP